MGGSNQGNYSQQIDTALQQANLPKSPFAQAFNTSMMNAYSPALAGMMNGGQFGNAFPGLFTGTSTPGYQFNQGSPFGQGGGNNNNPGGYNGPPNTPGGGNPPPLGPSPYTPGNPGQPPSGGGNTPGLPGSGGNPSPGQGGQLQPEANMVPGGMQGLSLNQLGSNVNQQALQTQFPGYNGGWQYAYQSMFPNINMSQAPAGQTFQDLINNGTLTQQQFNQGFGIDPNYNAANDPSVQSAYQNFLQTPNASFGSQGPPSLQQYIQQYDNPAMAQLASVGPTDQNALSQIISQMQGGGQGGFNGQVPSLNNLGQQPNFSQGTPGVGLTGQAGQGNSFTSLFPQFAQATPNLNTNNLAASLFGQQNTAPNQYSGLSVGNVGSTNPNQLATGMPSPTQGGSAYYNALAQTLNNQVNASRDNLNAQFGASGGASRGTPAAYANAQFDAQVLPQLAATLGQAQQSDIGNQLQAANQGNSALLQNYLGTIGANTGQLGALTNLAGTAGSQTNALNSLLASLGQFNAGQQNTGTQNYTQLLQQANQQQIQNQFTGLQNILGLAGGLAGGGTPGGSANVSLGANSQSGTQQLGGLLGSGGLASLAAFL